MNTKSSIFPDKIQQKTEYTVFCAYQVNKLLTVQITQKGIHYIFCEKQSSMFMTDNNPKKLSPYENIYYHYVYQDKSMKNAWKVHEKQLEIKFSYPKSPLQPIFIPLKTQKKDQNTKTTTSKVSKQVNIFTQNPEQDRDKQNQKYLIKFAEIFEEKIQSIMQINLDKINKHCNSLLQKLQNIFIQRFAKFDEQIKQSQERIFSLNEKMYIQTEQQICKMKNNVIQLQNNIEQLSKKIQDSNQTIEQIKIDHEETSSKVDRLMEQIDAAIKQKYIELNKQMIRSKNTNNLNFQTYQNENFDDNISFLFEKDQLGPPLLSFPQQSLQSQSSQSSLNLFNNITQKSQQSMKTIQKQPSILRYFIIIFKYMCKKIETLLKFNENQLLKTMNKNCNPQSL